VTGTEDIGNEPSCSIERSLQVLGERWTLLILRDVFQGVTRFADFRSRLNISPNMLSARLNTLVDAGVLEQREYREPGSRTRASYHLTEAGKQLRVVLGALQQWGDEYRPRPSGPSILRRARHTGRPLHIAFLDDAGAEVPLMEVEMVAAADSRPTAAPRVPS
jgi:DNA-binding HxlR family transcriptional regulator